MALTYILKKQFIRHQLPFMSQTEWLNFTFPLLEQTRMVRHAIFYPAWRSEQGVFQYDELFADARRQPGRCA